MLVFRFLQKPFALFRAVCVRAMFAACGLLCCLLLLEAGLFLLGKGYLARREMQNRFSGAAGYTIMCFGESMTINVYPERLERLLNKRFPGAGFSVIDKGMSGSDSDYIVSIFEDSVDSRRPDMVIIMTGVSDSKDPVLYRNYYTGRKMAFFKNLKTYRLMRFLARDVKAAIARAGNGPNLEPVSEEPDAAPVAVAGTDAAPEADGGTGGALADRCFRRIESRIDRRQFRQAYDIFETEYLPAAGPADIYAHFRVFVFKLLFPLEKYEEAEVLLKRLMRDYPHDLAVIGCLTDSFLSQNKTVQAAAFFRRLIAKDEFFWYYAMLARILRHEGDEKGEEDALLRGMHKGFAYDLSHKLLALYWRQDRYEDSIRLLKEMEEAGAIKDMDWFYGSLAICFRAQGKRREAERYFALAGKSGTDYVHPKTAENLDYIARAALARGIDAVFMQYPMRKVGTLKKMLRDFGGSVFYIDNEQVFKDAVNRQGGKALFIDNFGGDFGHLTPEGARIMAENAAKSLSAGPLRFMAGRTARKNPAGDAD